MCSFQEKLYALSSQEAYQKFVTNPRQYLLPPMPRPLCRVAIIGPPKAGKSTLCKLLAQHYKAQLFDMEELVQPLLEMDEQQRFNRIKEETTKAAIEKVKVKMQQDLGELFDSIFHYFSHYRNLFCIFDNYVLYCHLIKLVMFHFR